jgi:hypothetical protein
LCPPPPDLSLQPGKQAERIAARDRLQFGGRQAQERRPLAVSSIATSGKSVPNMICDVGTVANTRAAARG